MADAHGWCLAPLVAPGRRSRWYARELGRRPVAGGIRRERRCRCGIVRCVGSALVPSRRRTSPSARRRVRVADARGRRRSPLLL